MRELRISITIIVSLLIAIGMVMIYSSSGVYAQEVLNDSGYFLKRHLVFLLLGIIAAMAAMSFDYRELRKYSKPLIIITIIMLVLVLIPGVGKMSFGARRWFSLGPLNFQPSELAKLTMIIYVADFLARKREAIRRFRKGFLPLTIIMGIVCFLIVKEPDLGNTLSIAAITLTMMMIAGARLKHLISICLLASPAIFVLVVMVPWRFKRIIAFLDPWSDPQGIGFQLSQSQIALGSGGLFGVGLGKSEQKLFYLPAAHTDFILSIIGEEMGFIGATAVILLFGLFVWQGARLCKRTLNPFGYYLAVGIMLMISIQAVVNIGVSIGAFPTKGLPLPFISYGGSALVMNMLAVGLLLNVSRMEDL